MSDRDPAILSPSTQEAGPPHGVSISSSPRPAQPGGKSVPYAHGVLSHHQSSSYYRRGTRSQPSCRRDQVSRARRLPHDR